MCVSTLRFRIQGTQRVLFLAAECEQSVQRPRSLRDFLFKLARLRCKSTAQVEEHVDRFCFAGKITSHIWHVNVLVGLGA